MLHGRKKQDEVARLMTKLSDNLTSKSLEVQPLSEILAQIKVYGRDPAGSDVVYSRSGISTLGQYSFGSYSADISREASRSIANALLQAPALRQDYVDLGFASEAADRLRIQDDEDEFLMSRTLFLLTYQTEVDWDELSTTHDLANSITDHLIRHGLRLSEKQHKPSQIESMALTETLKLLFNLSNALPNYQAFASAVKPLLTIMCESKLEAKPLQPPISSAINALANLDISPSGPGDKSTIAGAASHPSVDIVHVDRLILTLNQSVLIYKRTELEILAIPLLTVLRKIYDTGSSSMKQHMQQQLLPSQENRDLPIGKSDDLPSRLLQLTTSSGLLRLSECISALMYELSNKDANLYVRNVGYGFAAGYLVSHHLPLPDSARNGARNGASRGSEIKKEIPVNPVTGQRLDKETPETGPAMTDEEKEREAERLFVLFERLNATGVVDVQNPLQQAVEEGKFDQRVEELSDSN